MTSFTSSRPAVAGRASGVEERVGAIHGNANVLGATIFPHNVGLGAAGDPELVERIGRVTAREVLATGVDWTFAPTLAVARDPRWGRTYESYPEDPGLVAAPQDRLPTHDRDPPRRRGTPAIGPDRAAALWARSGPVPLGSAHPARRWAARCHLWPADCAWPEAARWLPYPNGGSLAAAFAPVADWTEAHPPAPTGVQLVHLDPEGRPREDRGGLSKRSHGTMAGAVCVTGAHVLRTPEALHVVEGIADALAVAARTAPRCLQAPAKGPAKPNNYSFRTRNACYWPPEPSRHALGPALAGCEMSLSPPPYPRPGGCGDRRGQQPRARLLVPSG